MPLKMKAISNIHVEGNVLFHVGYAQDRPFRFNPSNVSTVNNVQMESVRCGLADGSQSSNVYRMQQHTLAYRFLCLNACSSTPKVQFNNLSHVKVSALEMRAEENSIICL